MESKQVLIAMSGGVDSAVAAHLMQQTHGICAGAYLQMWDAGEENIADARSVADRLGMDFYVLDAMGDFRKQVVDHFVCAYEEGLTPNPCVVCNRCMKFGVLLEHALALGFQTVATGHYAQVRYNESTGRYLLCKAADPTKDQTYFLACLTQEQLSHAAFPLGGLTKEQARAIAQEQGFINARKRDSQDICFIPDGDYFAFMQRYTGKTYPAGDYLDMDGRVVGQHKSAVAYTLGQRKGLNLAMGAPVYVCGKDMQKNTVTVGPNEALFATTLFAEDWNWLPFPTLTEPMRVSAKARSRHTEQPATVYPEENGCARVVFDTPQRAITPGQAVVLYDGDTVVGSGTITHTL